MVDHVPGLFRRLGAAVHRHRHVSLGQRWRINSIHRDYANMLAYIEWGFTFVFAIEYGLLYCSPTPLRYAFSFYGLVDLLAILPGILAIYYSDAQYLLIIRIIRMLRIFRVLKLVPYLSQANYLLSALRGSKQKIIVFLASRSTNP